MNDIPENMPTRMASANLPQPSQCSTPALTKLSERLQPATAAFGTGELMGCLTLVAPSGMTAEDRTAWVAVARKTLSGIPADLLQRGCKKARETCRFASEIVPAILEETKAEWERRRKAYADELAWEANRNAPRLEKQKPEAVPREVTQQILREVREAMNARV